MSPKKFGHARLYAWLFLGYDENFLRTLVGNTKIASDNFAISGKEGLHNSCNCQSKFRAYFCAGQNNFEHILGRVENTLGMAKFDL